VKLTELQKRLDSGLASLDGRVKEGSIGLARTNEFFSHSIQAVAGDIAGLSDGLGAVEKLVRSMNAQVTNPLRSDRTHLEQPKEAELSPVLSPSSSLLNVDHDVSRNVIGSNEALPLRPTLTPLGKGPFLQRKCTDSLIEVIHAAIHSPKKAIFPRRHTDSDVADLGISEPSMKMLQMQHTHTSST